MNLSTIQFLNERHLLEDIDESLSKDNIIESFDARMSLHIDDQPAPVNESICNIHIYSNRLEFDNSMIKFANDTCIEKDDIDVDIISINLDDIDIIIKRKDMRAERDDDVVIFNKKQTSIKPSKANLHRVSHKPFSFSKTFTVKAFIHKAPKPTTPIIRRQDGRIINSILVDDKVRIKDNEISRSRSRKNKIEPILDRAKINVKKLLKDIDDAISSYNKRHTSTLEYIPHSNTIVMHLAGKTVSIKPEEGLHRGGVSTVDSSLSKITSIQHNIQIKKNKIKEHQNTLNSIDNTIQNNKDEIFRLHTIETDVKEFVDMSYDKNTTSCKKFCSGFADTEYKELAEKYINIIEHK